MTIVDGGLPIEVTAPANGQPTGSLVDLAVTETDPYAIASPDGGEPSEEAWVLGFTFASETCDDPQVIAVVCGEESPEKVPVGNPDLVTYAPFLIIGSDRCSTMETTRDRLGRARRHLLSSQAWAVERTFWTGEAEGDPAGPVARQSLTDSTADVLVDEGDAISGRDLIAIFDQALSDCLHGQQGMIHVTPFLLAQIAEDVLRWNGDRWLTPSGHVVVGGSGYTGGGPRPVDDGDGDAFPEALPAAPDLLAIPPAVQWAYATPYVHVLLGPVLDFTNTTSRVNRAVNTTTVLVERAAAAYHAACCKFAAAVDVAAPNLIDGGGP